MNGARAMTGACPPPARGHPARTLGATLALLLLLCASLAATSARAASPLTWSSSSIPGGGTPSAVSCASESLCVAVNQQGAGFSTSNPTSPSPTWISTLSDTGHSLNAVSCAPGGPCVAVDEAGEVFTSIGPSAVAWSSSSVPGAGDLTGVSCPAASLCVAVDQAGSVFTTTSPAGGSWTLTNSHLGNLRAVSCASQTLCVAVDSTGDAFSTTTPTGKWEEQKLDSEELVAVSCSAGGTCVAVDRGGHALASADPGSSAPTWSRTLIDGEGLTAVSCASTGLCVAVDGHGQARASDGPTAPIPVWSASTAGSNSLSGVSCLAGGFCLAVNSAGSAFAGRVNAPEATTVTPTEVTNAGATLAGVGQPQRRRAGRVRVRIRHVGRLRTARCRAPVMPTALGGAQGVSAQVSGLEAEHHLPLPRARLEPVGHHAWAPTTPSPRPSTRCVAIVHPHPSISGTPAVGQQLTCHLGHPLGHHGAADLRVAARPDPDRRRDQRRRYTVKGQDTGHHLQCQVTATDGGGSATAKSAFVTIPVRWRAGAPPARQRSAGRPSTTAG